LEDQLDKIRREEAEHGYNEAKIIVEDYVKNLRSQSTIVDIGQSTPVKKKAESPTMSSAKKYKRGGSRRRGRGGFTG
jgi:hypothetical protein